MPVKIEQCQILNIDKEKSTISPTTVLTKNNINRNSFIVSDTDEELLILIKFKQRFQLTNIVIYASNDVDIDENTDMSPPKLLYLYKTNTISLNFDDFDHVKPNKSIRCSPKKLHKGHKFELSSTNHKFNKMQYLAIYVKSNQNDSENTYLNGIVFNAVSTKNDMIDAHNINELNQLISQTADSAPINTFTEQTLSSRAYLYHYVRGECNFEECKSIQNITNILKQYKHFISSNSQKNIQSIYQNNYNSVDLLNDYNHLLETHYYDFENIYNSLIKLLNDDQCCNLLNCAMFQRNYRDRSMCNENKVYCCSNERDIAQQQLIERIHCYCFHTFDIGYKFTQKEMNILTQMVTDNDDSKTEDHISRTNINHFISSKQKQYENNFISNFPRLKSTQSRYTIPTQPSKSSNDTQNWDKYSYGIRYFYWSFYKNKVADAINEPVYHNMEDQSVDATFLLHHNHNKAHLSTKNNRQSLAYWYIAKKFDNLKEELTQNPICSISKHQFLCTLNKVTILHKTEKVKSILCPRMESKKYYETVFGSNITQKHLYAMLVYCNYDTLQYEYSKTYRHNTNESDIDLKKRHSNYYWIGRLLRECVECYGIVDNPNNKIENLTVWHGVNKEFLFPSMNAFIQGPYSTTTDRAVAVNFCGNEGLLLR